MLKVKVRIIGANHLEIETEEGTYLQSYNTIIAFQSYDQKCSAMYDFSHKKVFIEKKRNRVVYLLSVEYLLN